MIASTYSGVFELLKGYIGGILLLAAGATLFAYDQAPDKTVQSLKAFLSFLLAIAKSLVELVKSWLEKEIDKQRAGRNSMLPITIGPTKNHRTQLRLVLPLQHLFNSIKLNMNHGQKHAIGREHSQTTMRSINLL